MNHYQKKPLYVLSVTAPGPYMMYFQSDQLFDPFRRETGFSMRYLIL